MAEEDFESRFSVPVSDFRDSCSEEKVRTLVDFMWQVWAGIFDDEIRDLCPADMTKDSQLFLWHRFFKDNKGPMAATYQRFVDACTNGPIDSAGVGHILMCASELCDAEKYDLQTVQDLLMKLRRKSISFITLGSYGGFSGPDFSKVQMEKARETMEFGHKFKGKKDQVRAFVLTGELFTPKCIAARQGDSISGFH